MALTAAAESQSKRGTILIIVLALHAVGIWVIESGLSRAIVEMVAPPVETEIIEEEIQEEEEPPPPPPPEIETPPPFIPPPEVSVSVPVSSNAIQTVTREQPPAVVPPVMAPPAPPPAIPGTKPKLDMKKARSPDEYYPAASNRDNETGSVVIKCYVKTDGRCEQVSVETSSGYERLDEAAVKYATQGVRFTPGTESGKSAAMWYSFKVTFKQKTTR